ncbi:MAG TPA: hypothetical protein VFZ24_18530 [Longimicrobiales bacterium]
MDSDLRSRAEARLADAARARGLADPRPPFRERLRLLKQAHPAAFDRAIEHYEQRVLPALVEEEPLPVWIEYGRFLGSLTAAGAVTAIDESGRATQWAPAARASLVLFIPEDTASDVMILAQPAEPSPAQSATAALLVQRALKLE